MVSGYTWFKQKDGVEYFVTLCQIQIKAEFDVLHFIFVEPHEILCLLHVDVSISCFLIFLYQTSKTWRDVIPISPFEPDQSEFATDLKNSGNEKVIIADYESVVSCHTNLKTIQSPVSKIALSPNLP